MKYGIYKTKLFLIIFSDVENRRKGAKITLCRQTISGCENEIDSGVYGKISNFTFKFPAVIICIPPDPNIFYIPGVGNCNHS